jgi:hypothetical protein
MTALVKRKNLSDEEKLQIACFKKSQIPSGGTHFPIQ